jgi:hypothetical protein
VDSPEETIGRFERCWNESRPRLTSGRVLVADDYEYIGESLVLS